MTTEEILDTIDTGISKLRRCVPISLITPTPLLTRQAWSRATEESPRRSPGKKDGERALSDEAPAKIAAAQKKRWAAQKNPRPPYKPKIQ